MYSITGVGVEQEQLRGIFRWRELGYPKWHPIEGRYKYCMDDNHDDDDDDDDDDDVRITLVPHLARRM